MSVLYKVFTYVTQIKNKEVSFQNLINKGFKDCSEEESFIIRDSLKSIVNRYYFLLWEQNKIFPVEDKPLRDYFACALGQYHYVKDVTEERLLESFQEDADEFGTEFSAEKMIASVRKLGGNLLPISEKENEIIVKRLSINYSYPEWVVKMMGKHFGIKHSYKAIASSRKSIRITVNCNTFLTNAEKLLADDGAPFEKGVLAKNALRYVSKSKIIELPEFRKNQIFVEDEASQMLVEKLGLEPGDEALLIADDRGAVALDMAMHMKDVGTVHVACSDVSNLNSTRTMASRFKIHSLDVFETTIDLLLTHVGRETCDKVLLIPESSALGTVRRRPATLLTLQREDLDALIENERKSLWEACTYVKAGGTLVYAVFTYNKKESSLLVEEFLKEHAEFTLEEQKQVFAYEAPSDGVYYAVLKKKQTL